MVPSGARRALLDDRFSLVIDYEKGALSVHCVPRSDGGGLGPVDLAEMGGRPDLQAKLLRELGRDGSRVSERVLTLSKDEVLQSRFTLPRAAEENLEEVVRLEIDRVTPFSAEEVYHDYLEPRAGENDQEIEIELFVAPRSSLDPVLARLEALELSPGRVVPRSNREGATFDRLNLLKEARAQDRRMSLPGGLSSVLSLCLVALLVLNVLAWFHGSSAAISEVESSTDALKLRMAEARELRLAIEEMQGDLESLEALRRSLPASLSVLAEVTETLPSSTHLVRYGWRPPKLTLTGYSADAAKLASLLESRPAFEGARFLTAITKDSRSGLERFDLEVEVAASQRFSEQSDGR